jgi:hypothetical protein
MDGGKSMSVSWFTMFIGQLRTCIASHSHIHQQEMPNIRTLALAHIAALRFSFATKARL